jgi:STE24 endopeptidase
MDIFAKDKLKTLIITIIIGFPLYYGFMQIVLLGGDNFYIYLTIFMMCFTLLMTLLVPNVIMPLFNKYDELDDTRIDLKNKIEELAKNLDFPLKKIFVMDASKRSSHSNAFYFGFGSNKRIVLFDTLLEQHKGEQGDKEIIAIVKHELGHWYYMHPLKSMVINLTNLTIIFYLFSLTLNNKGILASFGFN